MIKIYLPDDFDKNPVIDNIYDKIADKIYLNGVSNISFTYKGQKRKFNSKQELKSFLLSKNFYDYKFDCKSQCNIFAYNQLTSKDRHSILNEMNVRVCPYCNMNYTIGYKKNGSIKNTADIDHFYIKSKYPEYALCLYNFVPSCTVCNERIKRTTDMSVDSHIYPHKESFEGKSHFQITNLAEYLNQKSTDNLNAKINLINIIMDKLIEDKVENSIKDFELNERYKYFSHYVEKLIENVQIYNESYNNVLIKSFDDLITEDRIKYAIFGTNLSEEEYGKISLGKLKQDILYQLGIFESIEYD